MTRERLELTFGPKDADLWEYISAPGLPKASLVKSIIREHMSNRQNAQSVIAFSPQPVQKKEAIHEKEITIQVESPVKPKTSPFGGFGKKL